MTSRPEPFRLHAWVLRSGGGDSALPLLHPLTPDPDAAPVVLAFDEFDHLCLRFDSPDSGALLALEGLEAEVRAGRTCEVTGAGGEGEYSWYPGTYALTVRARGEQWHGLFTVRPRHFSSLDDLERLRRDLENLVAGLSLDVVAGRGYMGRHGVRPRGGRPARQPAAAAPAGAAPHGAGPAQHRPRPAAPPRPGARRGGAAAGPPA